MFKLGDVPLVLQRLKRWRVLVGRDPRHAPERSIIVFPATPAILPCGLSGILAIKPQQRAGDAADTLPSLFEKIRKNNLKTLLAGSMDPQEYLGGRELLHTLEGLILDLKKDPLGLFSQNGSSAFTALSKAMDSFLSGEDILIEETAGGLSTGEMELINESLEILKDAAWALEKDILANVEKTMCLAGPAHKGLSEKGLGIYWRVNLLLNALDRIEVRGRDSAGIEISFCPENRTSLDNSIKTLKADGLYEDFLKRTAPGDLLDGSITLSGLSSGTAPQLMTFTYKRASITGALGENTRYLRDSIQSDEILRTCMGGGTGHETLLAHTRWASVGAINVENCHPVNNFSLATGIDASSGIPLPVKHYPRYGSGNWAIHVALNGDIDNYRSLRTSIEADGEEVIDHRMTTDTKIIALQVEKYLNGGDDLQEAFRLALNDFEGSHAIAMQSNLEPGKVFLALRGSGQSLYIGLCNNQYIFSSEVYGLVELTPRFIKMDGEAERIPGRPETKGQVYVLEGGGGMRASSYDGHPLQIGDRKIQKAQITTRDIDRKGYPHFLLKEIADAPLSVKKTLRGKYRIEYSRNGSASVTFNLGDDIIPRRLHDALTRGDIRNIFVIGQGTAAIAGAAIAGAFSKYIKGPRLAIEAKAASELSGFCLEEDLTDTLVIAVTQSGTTTDTNRAVAMAKERGAHLIAIVNRRQSDITHVADGVFYTSDGRDIEMSVASTKAFYSQIVAGYVLTLYMAQTLGTLPDNLTAEVLENLEQAPDAMNRVIAGKEHISETARSVAGKKRYWAVVGSGPNKVAADEIRIKLSELCYKTISSDIVEDKKHIDLSSEPLILACVAGTPNYVLEDIVKDVSIFKAHSASVVVIADEGERAFDGIADSVIHVPKASFPISVILNTLAGHLWGYYAACTINEDGEFIRDFRKRLLLKTDELDAREGLLVEKLTDPGLHKLIDEFSTSFHARKNLGFFSSMGIDVASDITLLLKYASGRLPLEEFRIDFKEQQVSSSPLDMLDISLGRAIDELARPIDAIRHQAKTVTVGTSRKEEAVRGVIFDFLKDLGFSLENLTSKGSLTIGRLQKVTSNVRGYTLYAISDLDDEGKPTDRTTISIERRGGISLHMKSRAESPIPLSGAKKTIVSTGDAYAGIGKSDNAPLVIIPLIEGGTAIHRILLLHVIFKEALNSSEKKAVLGDKLNPIRDIINEYNVSWSDGYLKPLPVAFLLGEGINVIAERIMNSLEMAKKQ
ncbi:MAG: SIS domain-containing protein [Syntrophales bacterium]|nr:SIS domain-containing protein [Syntrophales bacterium]